MTPSKHLLFFLPAISAIALLPAVLASGEEIHELEPVVVKGDLLGTSIERLPASVTVIDTRSDSALGNAHFENLLGKIPNLNWAGGTSRPRFLQIRGVGENSQFGNELPVSSVGFIIDGIDFTGMGSVAGLFDVSQVEVLRGPQAAAFGANALAGLVIVETTAPSESRQSKIEATVGEYDLLSFGVASGGSLSPKDPAKLSYRISLHQYQDNGYRKNRFLGRDDTNERDELTARLKLAWRPSPKLETDLTLLYFDFDNGYDVWSLTNNSFVTTTDEPGRDEQETVAAGIKLLWHLNDSIDLTSHTSGSESDILYSFDWDWSNPAELESLYGPEVYWGSEVTERTRTVFSQDLRASSPTGFQDADRLENWVAGLYYRDFEEEQSYFGVDSRYETETAAMYGQARLALSQLLSLTLAGRIEELSSDFSDTLGNELADSETTWGGKISIDYSPVDGQVLYASIDRGFKAGGINLDNDIPQEERVYSTETLLNYELGWRGLFLDNRLRLRTTVFYMDRQDIQVDSSIQLGDGSSFALYKDNAASGYNYGLEIEIDWQVSEWFRVFANAGLLNTAFDDYRYIDPADGVTEIVLDDREQGYAPNYTYAAGLEFKSNNGLFLELELQGKDSYVFDVANRQSLAAYTLVGARLGYTLDQWEFTLWANNLLDERYDTRGFYFANEPPAYDNPRKWVSQGAPRQIGFSVRREF